jgi:hypothetical protein
MKTQVTISEITQDDLVNLFSTAFYGSNYLAADYKDAIEYDEDDCHEEILAKILLNGGEILVTDYDADGCHYGNLRWEYNEDYDVTYHVRYEDIVRGLEKAGSGTFNARPDVSEDFADRNIKFAKSSFNAFAYDDTEWDLTTADCLMQIILFDEIIYG